MVVIIITTNIVNNSSNGNNNTNNYGLKLVQFIIPPTVNTVNIVYR